MIAGVLLGPTLFGLVAPDLQAALFPPESKKILYVGAQLGVGLYMFLVGLGFDRIPQQCASGGIGVHRGDGGALAAAALLVPWMLGIDGLFAAKVNQAQATLFLGRQLPSLPSRCLHASSMSAASAIRRWVRSRSPQAQSVMQARGS